MPARTVLTSWWIMLHSGVLSIVYADHRVEAGSAHSELRNHDGPTRCSFMCLSFAAGVARGKKEDETQAPAKSCVHIYRSWPVSKSLLTVLTMRKRPECRRLPVLAYGGPAAGQPSPRSACSLCTATVSHAGRIRSNPGFIWHFKVGMTRPRPKVLPQNPFERIKLADRAPRITYVGR